MSGFFSLCFEELPLDLLQGFIRFLVLVQFKTELLETYF